MTSIAFLWAFAEAVVFFILPDVFLFPAVVWNPSPARRLVCACVAGSVLGSALLYVLAQHFAADVLTMINHISLVSETKLSACQHIVNQSQLWSFILQPYSLIPLKAFVFYAAQFNLPLLPVLLYIAIGRAVRNALIAWCAAFIGARYHDTVRKHWRAGLCVYAASAITFVVLSMIH